MNHVNPGTTIVNIRRTLPSRLRYNICNSVTEASRRSSSRGGREWECGGSGGGGGAALAGFASVMPLRTAWRVLGGAGARKSF